MAESKDRKRFDLEYKRKIVRLVEELGQSPNQGANEIGVTPPQKTIRNWVRKFGKGDFGAFPGKGNLHPVDEELRQMKKQIKDFQEKNAIPKKLWPSSPGTGNMVPIHQRPPLRIIRSEECLVLEVSRSAFTDG
jgi:transposase